MLTFNRSKRRGYIGPIGDDLPSLIPLIFALAVFFATFSNTLNTFEKKNALFDLDLEVFKIARIMRGNGFYTGVESFHDACDLVRAKNVYFFAMIVPIPPNTNDPYNFSLFKSQGGIVEAKSIPEMISNKEILSDPRASDSQNAAYICPSISAIDAYAVPFSGSAYSEGKLLTRSFPIAVSTVNEEGYPLIDLGQLVVVIWR